jgi:hypothetical protein
MIVGDAPDLRVTDSILIFGFSIPTAREPLCPKVFWKEPLPVLAPLKRRSEPEMVVMVFLSSQSLKESTPLVPT